MIFGVRSGFRVAYKKREMPTAKELLAFGEIWRPHRTTAAWFLWCARTWRDGEEKEVTAVPELALISSFGQKIPKIFEDYCNSNE